MKNGNSGESAGWAKNAEPSTQATPETPKERGNAPKWDRIYKESKPENIPWNFEEIPTWFTEMIESGWVKPCKTLDVGCGLGNYANYLATSGFDVVAVDFSEEAVIQARKKFEKSNLRFEVGCALELDSVLDVRNPEMFEFIIDISLLHHIKPEDREKYAQSLARVAKRGAKVLISCFSERDPVFAGQKIFLNPDSDTVTYVLSNEDIITTFEEMFDIEELAEVEFGKFSKIGNSMTRRRHLVKLVRK